MKPRVKKIAYGALAVLVLAVVVMAGRALYRNVISDTNNNTNTTNANSNSATTTDDVDVTCDTQAPIHGDTAAPKEQRDCVTPVLPSDADYQ